MSQSAKRAPLLTAEDVERISIPGKIVELVRGQLVVGEPPGTKHGIIAGNLTHYLSSFVRQHELGVVAVQDTGFRIGRDPDTVRAPDVAFLARDRVPQVPERGYAELAPDLLAEVLSPGDAPAYVLGKLSDWLAAGTKLVWLVDPQRSEVRVYRSDGTLSVLGLSDSLDGEDVLPGFSCPVAKVFE
jgi:Uma2 family endonuclease